MKFPFVVTFTGFTASRKKVGSAFRKQVRKYRVLAEDAHRAIDLARARVERDRSLNGAIRPTYLTKEA